MDLRVRARMDEGKTLNVKNGREIRGFCLSPILSHCYSEWAYLTKIALHGFREFKIGRLIYSVKWADDLLLLAKEDVVLKGIMDRLIEAARQCGVEVNVEKPRQ